MMSSSFYCYRFKTSEESPALNESIRGEMLMDWITGCSLHRKVFYEVQPQSSLYLDRVLSFITS